LIDFRISVATTSLVMSAGPQIFNRRETAAQITFSNMPVNRSALLSGPKCSAQQRKLFPFACAVDGLLKKHCQPSEGYFEHMIQLRSTENLKRSLNGARFIIFPTARSITVLKGNGPQTGYSSLHARVDSPI
jgi:hypothetical protein